MENPKVSILVPIYNVEKYLRRCIDSVLSQDFRDYELILVDDGSPDRCPQICDEYAEKDSRIKVVHKANGGLVSARLAGFKEARGDFFLFLDGDDWLLPKALSMLYKTITSDSEIDIVRCVVERISENGDKWLEHYDNEGDIVGSGIFFEDLQHDKIAPYLHSGIYRASLFNEAIFKPLIFNDISVGEDWITNYSIAPIVKRVKFISTPTYAYFLNTSSMMGSSVYGWEYYERIQKCMAEINHILGVKKSERTVLTSALCELRFFFLPEVPFNKKQFNRIQPIILNGLKHEKIKKTFVNPNYLCFISIGWLFHIYTIIFRYAFLLIKLKGKKRKVLK